MEHKKRMAQVKANAEYQRTNLTQRLGVVVTQPHLEMLLKLLRRWAEPSASANRLMGEYSRLESWGMENLTLTVSAAWKQLDAIYSRSQRHGQGAREYAELVRALLSLDPSIEGEVFVSVEPDGSVTTSTRASK